ncbi:MinD/ParA family protein [Streptomyces sp. NPDC059708]|uniref:MinD/ParA family ATP-binding protein n=1 Tax=Streptomyces sp. NPDC059708 TaxID=3346916 RepID=UPI0036944567
METMRARRPAAEPDYALAAPERASVPVPPVPAPVLVPPVPVASAADPVVVPAVSPQLPRSYAPVDPRTSFTEAPALLGALPPPDPGTRLPDPAPPVFGEDPLSFREFQQAAGAVAPAAPAEWGWRGRVRRFSGGLMAPAMGKAEAAHKEATARVQSSLPGPRTIVFVNPKGGATTTTSTLMAGRTFGVLRGGGVVAWDNNETRGTLGARARPAGHWNSARELLDNIALFEHSATARIGDLGLYMRGQGGAHFDVLASDERPEVTGHIDGREVGRLHGLFERFYRLILIDTGNNMRAPNWLEAVRRADLLVVTTTVREDSASSALWMLDALERNVFGPGLLKSRTLTLLTAPAPRVDESMRNMMVNHFGGRTRAVMQIPFDEALVSGGIVDYDRLSPTTHKAWLFACAAMAEALTELPDLPRA